MRSEPVPFSCTKEFYPAADMDQDNADHVVDYALDNRICHFDTANLYAKGDSE